MFSLSNKELSRKSANSPLSRLTSRAAKTWLPGVLAGAAGVAIFAAASSGNVASASVLSSNFNGSLDNWTPVAGTGYTVADTGAESAFTNDAGGASADLVDNSSSANPTLTSPTFSGITTNDAVQISFDFNILAASTSENDSFLLNSSTGYDPSIVLNLGSASPTSNSPTAGDIVYKNGNTGVTANFAPSINTWYRVILNLAPSDAASPTWGFSVVDTSNTTLYSANNIAFFKTLNPSSYNAQFLFNNGTTGTGGQFLVDNVNVGVVPEPTPLALLACGLTGMTLLLIRRRKNI